jgi:hypothetical protein
MLASFARAADAVGVAHREVLGEWPKIAGRVGQADLVVCRNVVYNVADIVPFVTALSARAARRVAVELTAVHPSVAMAPVWKRFWGLDRPDGPSAALFAAVVADLGFEPVMESENRPVAKATDGGADYVAFVRRRLCLPAQRDGEIANALAATDTVVTAVAVVWDPRVGSYRKPAGFGRLYTSRCGVDGWLGPRRRCDACSAWLRAWSGTAAMSPRSGSAAREEGY